MGAHGPRMRSGSPETHHFPPLRATALPHPTTESHHPMTSPCWSQKRAREGGLSLLCQFFLVIFCFLLVFFLLSLLLLFFLLFIFLFLAAPGHLLLLLQNKGHKTHQALSTEADTLQHLGQPKQTQRNNAVGVSSQGERALQTEGAYRVLTEATEVESFPETLEVVWEQARQPCSISCSR